MDEIEDLEEGPKVPKEDHVKGRLVNCMLKRIESIDTLRVNPGEFTIFRVPENIRKNNPHLFDPAVISIGPYHRGRSHLRAMEETNWLYLRDFLCRKNGLSLEYCVEAIRALEMQARRCYSETIDMDSDTFIEMMVLDGCFILEYLIQFGPEQSRNRRDASWNFNMVRTDLILIENQIPFLILRSLYCCLCGEDIPGNTIKYMCSRFALGIREFASYKLTNPPEVIHHLLHLYHHYIIPANMLDCELPITFQTVQHHDWSLSPLPCATQLREAGIKIRKKKSPFDFTNVTFQSRTLEIPSFIIGDNTQLHLMNLVALEQCESLNLFKVVSRFNWFMDGIMKTREDVLILERCDIIENLLSGQEAVAIFFNQSGQGVRIGQDHKLGKLSKEINEFCWSRKHRYKAKLRRDYFSNPWSALSLFAAILLLLLTCTQTFYAVFAYHHPPP